MVYGLYALSSGTGVLAPVIRALASEARELGISTGMPGPHDFAVRVVLARPARHPRPPHPALNVRDDAYAPPIKPGPSHKTTISVNQKQNYFRVRGWTAESALKAFTK